MVILEGGAVSKQNRCGVFFPASILFLTLPVAV